MLDWTTCQKKKKKKEKEKGDSYDGQHKDKGAADGERPSMARP